MKKTIILLVISLFMVGCATNNSSNARAKNIAVSQNAKEVLADKNSDEKVICKQTRRMGSNRITTVCLSQSEVEERRQTTLRELNKRVGRGTVGKPGN